MRKFVNFVKEAMRSRVDFEEFAGGGVMKLVVSFAFGD